MTSEPVDLFLACERSSDPRPIVAVINRYGFRVTGVAPVMFAPPPDGTTLVAVTILTVSAADFLRAFVTRIATRLADDSYLKLRTFLTELVAGRPAHVVRVEDPERHLRVFLPHDLPTVAYQKLFEVDLASVPDHASLRWHSDSMTWRAEQQQAARS